MILAAPSKWIWLKLGLKEVPFQDKGPAIKSHQVTKKTFLARIGNGENGFVSLWTPVMEPIWWNLAQCSNIAKRCYSWQLSTFDMPLPLTHLDNILLDIFYAVKRAFNLHTIDGNWWECYVNQPCLKRTELSWYQEPWCLSQKAGGRQTLSTNILCVLVFMAIINNKMNKMKIWKIIEKSKLSSPQHDKKCVFWRHSTIDLAFDNDENITKSNGRGIRVQLNFFRPKKQMF